MNFYLRLLLYLSLPWWGGCSSYAEQKLDGYVNAQRSTSPDLAMANPAALRAARAQHALAVQQLNAETQASKEACYQRFAVNACITDILRTQRRRSDSLRQQAQSLDEMERLLQVEEKKALLAQRQTEREQQQIEDAKLLSTLERDKQERAKIAEKAQQEAALEAKQRLLAQKLKREMLAEQQARQQAEQAHAEKAQAAAAQPSTATSNSTSTSTTPASTAATAPTPAPATPPTSKPVAPPSTAKAAAPAANTAQAVPTAAQERKKDERSAELQRAAEKRRLDQEARKKRALEKLAAYENQQQQNRAQGKKPAASLDIPERYRITPPAHPPTAP